MASRSVPARPAAHKRSCSRPSTKRPPWVWRCGWGWWWWWGVGVGVQLSVGMVLGKLTQPEGRWQAAGRSKGSCSAWVGCCTSVGCLHRMPKILAALLRASARFAASSKPAPNSRDPESPSSCIKKRAQRSLRPRCSPGWEAFCTGGWDPAQVEFCTDGWDSAPVGFCTDGWDSEPVGFCTGGWDYSCMYGWDWTGTWKHTSALYNASTNASRVKSEHQPKHDGAWDSPDPRLDPRWLAPLQSPDPGLNPCWWLLRLILAVRPFRHTLLERWPEGQALCSAR